MPVELQMPGGFIGGQLARRAFDQSIEAGKAEIEGQQVSNAQKAAELQQTRKAMAAQARLEETLQNMPDLGEQIAADPATAMARIAGAALDSGQPGVAVEILGKSATANKDSAIAAKNRLDAEAKRAENLGAAMEGVNDSTSWRAALTGMIITHPEERDSLHELLMLPQKAEEQGLTFDYAAVAGALQKSSLDRVKKAQIEAYEAQAQHDVASAAEQNARATQLVPALTRAADALASKREKEGDLTTKGKKATTTDAKNRIMKDYDVEGPEATVLALAVADRTIDLQASTPGLTRTDALDMAYKEYQKSNLFAGLKPTRKAAGTREMPLALPMADDQIDTARLQDNLFYNTSRGLLLWDAKQKVFRRAPAPRQYTQIEPEENEDERIEPEDEE